MNTKLTTEMIIRAYSEGLFPMAEGKDSKKVFWMSPATRGIIPLSSFHISKSLLHENYKLALHPFP